MYFVLSVIFRSYKTPLRFFSSKFSSMGNSVLLGIFPSLLYCIFHIDIIPLKDYKCNLLWSSIK